MSAYKQFTNKDIVISPFKARKRFYGKGDVLTGSIAGLDTSNGYGIDFLWGGIDTGSISAEYTITAAETVTKNISYPFEQVPDTSKQKLIFEKLNNYNTQLYGATLVGVGSNPPQAVFALEDGSPSSASNNFVGFVKPTKFGPLVHNAKTVFNSIKHLYYSNYISGSRGDLVATESVILGTDRAGDTFIGNKTSPQFENYVASTPSSLISRSFGLFIGKNGSTISASRKASELGGKIISVISIPQQLYGDYIEPGSFEFIYTSSVHQLNTGPLENQRAFLLKDDGNGNIISSSGEYYGNIFYNHGIVTVLSSKSTGSVTEVAARGRASGQYNFEVPTTNVNPSLFALDMMFQAGPIYPTSSQLSDSIAEYHTISESTIRSSSVAFTSSFSITEHQYKCTLGSGDFNYSLNPTLLSGSNNDEYHHFATGSYFTPYITSIGLYNDHKELLAVAKLSNPLKKPKKADLTLQINFDI